MNFIEYVPDWKKVLEYIFEPRNSVWVFAPKSYGKKGALKAIHERMPETFYKVEIDIQTVVNRKSREINYAAIWEEITSQLSSKSRKEAVDSDSLLHNFVNLITRGNTKLILIFKNGERGIEQQQYDLISLFYQSLTKINHSQSKSFVNLLILDDYSLYYYEKWRIAAHRMSNLKGIHKIYCHPFSLETIKVIVKNFSAFYNINFSKLVPDITTVLFKFTGGHPGLIMECLRDIHFQSSDPNFELTEEKIEKLINSSDTLESLRNALEEDPLGLTSKALDFVKPKMLVDFNSPTTHYLKQLGIIQISSSVLGQLCPGVIKELVESLNKEASETQPLGTTINPFNVLNYDSEVAEISDSDFVILHLSDLHVGNNFQFEIPGVEKSSEFSKTSLSKLIYHDLASLGIHNRIDGILFTGDFTKTADYPEFTIASELIEELMKKLGIDLSRISIVPGNHDLNWNPNKQLQTIDPVTGVSRDAYKQFRKLLGKTGLPGCEVDSIQSIDKSNELNIICVDSDMVESPQGHGIGYVSTETLQSIRDYSSGIDNNGEAKENGVNKIKWLITHHHVLPSTSVTPEDAKDRNVSLLANSSELLDVASAANVEVILHGHEHQPSITYASRWDADKSNIFSPILTIGAGSVAAEREDLGSFGRNHYYILIRRKEDLIIRSRALTEINTSFFTHADISIKLDVNP